MSDTPPPTIMEEIRILKETTAKHEELIDKLREAVSSNNLTISTLKSEIAHLGTRTLTLQENQANRRYGILIEKAEEKIADLTKKTDGINNRIGD